MSSFTARFSRSARNDAGRALMTTNAQYWLPRQYLLHPVQEIWTAANLLHEAVEAHFCGNHERAEMLVQEADIPAIAAWTDCIWGKHRPDILRWREVPDSPPSLRIDQRPQPRMPT